MLDLRPVGYVIGLLVAVLGAAMIVPMTIDLIDGDPGWSVFFECAVITMACGGLLALSCLNSLGQGMTVQHSFVLTSGVWLAVPAFGALPFMLGAPGASFTDAYFEAMSGVTTTGATVFDALDALPRGVNLWRGILQWLGGLGIIIVAMIFLPVMKVGGMQYFRSEGFDTLGKILPRAGDISNALIRIYLALTILCAGAYAALGMPAYDAFMHSLTTVSTGGFSSNDASFAPYRGAPEYASAIFMLLASMPFVRFVQLAQGQATPLWRDVQVRAYLRWTGYAIAAIVAYRVWRHEADLLPTIREATFNVVSIFSGTGYASEDITLWGHMAFVVLIVTGLIGGCTSSTGCSVKIFRWLVVIETVRAYVRRLHSPHRVLPIRLDGRSLDDEVVSAVMAFISLFIVTFGALIVGLSLTGLPSQTAITAAWTSIANVGPAWGPGVGPTGAMDAFPETAKWLMIIGMFLGRLELMSVFVLLLPRFWRN